MRVLSLFDGIACGRVALERAGVKVDCYHAYEIEKNAISIACANYPDIVEKGDVFKAVYNVGDYDLLLGGSPCTYWSIAKAGNKEKRETTASGLGWDLFSQYVRALRQVKPKYFIYENNASMSKEIKDCITYELGVEPVEIDSADFSAQHRHRLYWTNFPILKYKKSNLLFSDILDKNETSYKFRDFSKYKDTIKISRNGMAIYYDTSGKGNYGQPNRARKIFQKWNTLTASGIDKNDIWVDKYLARHITPLEAERLQTLPDNYTLVLKSPAKRASVCGNGWTVDVIVHILKSMLEDLEKC